MNEAPPIARPRRKVSSLAMMLVLVACLAVGFWAWRRAMETSPARDLAAGIRSGPANERVDAMLALWQVPPEEAVRAAPALLEALNDPDPEIRIKAAETLFYALQTVDDPGQIAALTPPLLQAMNHSDPVVRGTAASLLGRIYMTVPAGPLGTTTSKPLPSEVWEALLRACEDSDSAVVAPAIEALALDATDRATLLRVLLKAATHANPGVRSVAINRLFPLAQKSQEACLAVMGALNDPSLEVRTVAAIGSNIPSPYTVPPAALPGLIRALDDRTLLNVRLRAFTYLEAMGPAAKSAIPAILRFVPENKIPIHDDGAIRALGAIAPGSAEARAFLPQLLSQARSKESGWLDRNHAVNALGTFLWEPEVVELMKQAKQDPDGNVRQAAIHALSQLPVTDDDIQEIP